MKVDLLIKNGVLLPMTGRDVLRAGSIAIDDGKIVGVSGSKDAGMGYESDRIIDASGKIVMPGLINTHTHLAMTLFRGVNDDLSGMKWLERAWKIESNLNPEDVYWGSKLGVLEFIKTGTTCFADHYFFPEKVVDAVEDTGLRAAIARPIFDEGGPDIDTSLETGLEFTEEYAGAAGGRLTTLLGPHATYSCAPSLLSEIGNISEKKGYGVHIHMAEGKEEMAKLEEEYGKRPVGYMDDAGLLGPNLLGAHVVYVNEEEIARMGDKGVNVSYQPTAKMRGGEGVTPVPEMLEAGVNVSVGTDGAGSKNHLDLLSEINIAALVNKLVGGRPTVIDAWDVLEMGTINGAKSLGLEDQIGSLEEGKRADIIMISTDAPQMTPFHNIPSQLAYGSSGCNVDTVIVDGEVLMEDRRTHLDEETIKLRSQETFERLLARSNMQSRFSGTPKNTND
ncbi:MAG: amidohydrolase [Candidatus Bipolaricaulota bacterium]|nr:amidohydrolase [Candidatus Bipolaricaulota bacterium]